MNSIVSGIGFSHHKVPSLSNTATRSSAGTDSDPSSPRIRRTNPPMSCLAPPPRQLGSRSVTVFSVRVEAEGTPESRTRDQYSVSLQHLLHTAHADAVG